MDLEARAHSEHPEALRLWLRLLTCAQLIEKQVRGGLREQFDTTLPRFDLMAQLERAEGGMKMNELSRRMMVTGGNVTGITDQLVAEGLVERLEVAGDRRAFLVRLGASCSTPVGVYARLEGHELVLRAAYYAPGREEPFAVVVRGDRKEPGVLGLRAFEELDLR